ncbi:MAG: sigma-70 family RNA polymerase sigma factor [Caldilineaceae bacterium]
MYSKNQPKDVEPPAVAGHRGRGQKAAHRRADHEWVADLAGRSGVQSQEAAHQDLANYLFRVAASYLDMRQESVSILYALSAAELAELAQDFVQDTLEKLARNQHALLTKYGGTGRFTSWMAQVIRNEIAGELRRAAWQKRAIYDPADVLTHVTSVGDCPEQMAAAAQIGEVLHSCLQQLPAHYRIAVWDRLVEGDSAEEVGERLGISANAVNLLVFRGKKKLRAYLEEAGVDAEILSVFTHASPADGSSLRDVQMLC